MQEVKAYQEFCTDQQNAIWVSKVEYIINNIALFCYRDLYVQHPEIYQETLITHMMMHVRVTKFNTFLCKFLMYIYR